MGLKVGQRVVFECKDAHGEPLYRMGIFVEWGEPNCNWIRVSGITSLSGDLIHQSGMWFDVQAVYTPEEFALVMATKGHVI